MKLSIPAAPFTDGLVLDPDALNKALYDDELTTLTAQGLYSEFNGGCDLRSINNGSVNFRLHQDHLQPEQAIKSRYAGNWYTLDNFSNVSGFVNDEDRLKLTQMAQAQALPGTGIRMYVPFEASAVRFNVSWFWAVARWLGLDNGNPGSATAAGTKTAEIHTLVFVRTPGEPFSEVRPLRRQYPQTFFRHTTTAAMGTGTEPNPWTSESAQCSSWNLSHLVTAATKNDPQARLAAGFYEAFVGFYVKPLKDANLRTNNNVRYDRGDINIVKTTEVYQRLTVGCRNARVVAFR